MDLNRNPYFISKPDDSYASIPTLGFPTTACDLYRAVGYTVNGHEGWNSCFADIETCNGLVTLIEGEVTSWDQIEAAELALQILMWHDRLDVMVPAFKQKSENMVFYKRCEIDRKNLAFDLFKEMAPYDVLFVVEEAIEKGGVIIESSDQASPLIGLDPKMPIFYLNCSRFQAMAFSSIPHDFGVPAYFSNSILKNVCQRNNWFKRLYFSLRSEWEKAVKLDPDFEFDLVLPPLLSIVLHRANKREQIPEAINELRHETLKIRNEIIDFSNYIDEIKQRGVHQNEIYKKCKYIQESFDHIVKATASDSFLHQNLIRLFLSIPSPLISIIDALTPEKVDISSRIIADRTVCGQMLTKYLKVDSIVRLLEKHFTITEVMNIYRQAARTTF